MIRHVVMFRWVDGASDEAKAAVAAGLAQLPGAIDAIARYRFGPDAGLADGNWDFTVTGDFASVDDYLTYRDDEVHQRLIREKILPIVAERAAVQFAIDD